MNNSDQSKESKNRSLLTRFFRLLVPKRTKSSDRPDMVRQTRDLIDHEQRTVSALLPAIPAAAVIERTDFWLQPLNTLRTGIPFMQTRGLDGGLVYSTSEDSRAMVLDESHLGE